MKILKIFHLLFAVMWIGGVMALVCIELGTQPTNINMIMMSAIDQLIIDEYFLIPGGIGIVITAIMYGAFTKWGFFKFSWLKVKWILTILLVLLGAGYMGVQIKYDVKLIQDAMASGIAPDEYFTNIRNIAIAGLVQLVGFILITIISVFKPWKSKVLIK